MFKRIKSEFQCLKRKGRKFNLKKDKVGIPMFERIRWEFQCLKELGANASV